MTSLEARKLKNGSSGRPSRWTRELVFALMDDPDCVQGLGTLIGDMLNGHLPDQARAYLTCSVLIPVSKPGGGIRPIAVSEVFYRLAGIYARCIWSEISFLKSSSQSSWELVALEARACGSSTQGGPRYHGPDAVVQMRLQKAFNERKREQVLSDLFDEDSLQPIWRLSHWAYKAPSELLVLDNGEICASISSEQGVKQGDGLGSLLFSLDAATISARYSQCSTCPLRGSG